MLTLPTERLAIQAIDWCGLPRRFLNPNEMETLVALARSIGAESVLEIGVNEGRTARLMIENVSSIRSYYGVDVPPDSKYLTACAVQRKERPTNPGHHAAHLSQFQLLLRERGSLDLEPEDLPTFDMVFIDGDHGRVAVTHDSALAYTKVRPGGLVVWHDYHDLGLVDVREVLHELRDDGHKIINVEGTWIAYEVAL